MISLNIDYKSIKTELCEIGAKYDVDISSQRVNITDERHSHPYTILYHSIFKNYRDKPLNIAVISLLNSNSLLMWSEYFPNAKIYGFEYNEEYINYFKDFITDKDKIKLSIIDVRNENSINESFEKSNMKYDLIIDDSTHILEDQVRIIKNTYKYLKSGGLIIIEDIYKVLNEKEYIEGIGNDLIYFKEYFFITVDHVNRNSSDWNNDKLFLLTKKGIPIFRNNNKITIITPSIRINNLLELRKSINFNYVNEWIIVYDGNKVKENNYLFKDDIHKDKITEYIFKKEGGCSGNPQRNFALDNIKNKDTYLYFLDDDNLIDNNLYKLLNIIDDNKIYTFNQINRIKGDNIEIYKIDTAMFLIDYNLCKDIRWILDKYNADGHYIKDCYLKNNDKWIYVDNDLCSYNLISK